MPRQAPPDQRLPSQRASREDRQQAAEHAELKRKLEIAEEEKQIAMKHRNAHYAEKKQLEKEVEKLQPPTLHGTHAEIKKLKPKSTAFYEHVDFGVKWLQRFNVTDIPPLLVAVLRKLGRELGTNLVKDMITSEAMKSARDELLHEHEVKIAKHLSDKVYTADHFSLLRLVGGMSKRLCGLIEQAIKYVHNEDGTKKAQTLLPESTVRPASPHAARRTTRTLTSVAVPCA